MVGRPRSRSGSSKPLHERLCKIHPFVVYHITPGTRAAVNRNELYSCQYMPHASAVPTIPEHFKVRILPT